MSSFTFDSVDMGDYGLIVKNADTPSLTLDNQSQIIQDLSWPFKPKKPPKYIRLNVVVSAVDRETLDEYMDNIKRVTVVDDPYNLILDSLNDRYWEAKLSSFQGDYNGPRVWEGVITFVADDPLAYASTETSSDHTIDADPKTVSEVVGGTGYVLPVFTLTADEDIEGYDGDTEITIENLTSDESLTWTGTLGSGEELEVDADAWTVKKEGVDDMNISGQFPRLAPNQTNQIRITGFSGSLNITYRARYL